MANEWQYSPLLYIIKYQSFVYGSFVWEIHVRYNKNIYIQHVAQATATIRNESVHMLSLARAFR